MIKIIFFLFIYKLFLFILVMRISFKNFELVKIKPLRTYKLPNQDMVDLCISTVRKR